MNAPENNKDIRRQKFLSKGDGLKRDNVSEEQKFLSRSKKQHKKRIEEIKSEELWEDWEDNNY